MKAAMFKKVALAAAVVFTFAAPAAVQAATVDITTLPGYQVVDSALFNFGPFGWAGWSISGKEVLGAKIISAGSISNFSAFRPVGPGETTPFGYTYGANEYGFILQNALNGPNNGVQMELYYADPLAGYTISKSSQLNYSATGWGGWSAPSGNVVSGGGYQFLTQGAHPGQSELALENSVWPHYTFGPNEQGWVVQNDSFASAANVYVISFAAPVPEPATWAMMLIGFAGIGFVAYRRTKKRGAAIAAV